VQTLFENLKNIVDAMTPTFVALTLFLVVAVFAQQPEILSVSVTVDEGQERILRLHVGQSPLDAAKLFVVNELQMQPMVDGTQDPTEITLSLANILLTRLNEKNAEDFRLQQERQRQENNPVVFAFPVAINGNNVNMEIRAKSSASESAEMFCGSLRIDGQGLGHEDLGQCVESATSLAIQRITEYNNNQKLAATSQGDGGGGMVPLFEVPIQIGEEVLPLSIGVSENPAKSTHAFCEKHWGKISAILSASYTNGEEINHQLCHSVLLSTVVDMVDQMLASPEGQAAIAEHRLFSIKIELESTDGSTNSRFLDLNVFPGQTSDDAVSEFLRFNGISENAKSSLIQSVEREWARISNR